MNSFSIEQVLDHHPLIVTPSTPLIETIGLMNQSSVASCNLEEDDSEFNSLIHSPTSYALVVADLQLLGIFTERDLVQLTAEERKVAEITVGEAMNQPVTTFQETEVQDLFDILSLTCQHGIRHFPIVDKQQQLLGIITLEAVQRSLQPMDWLRLQRVEEVMSNTSIHAFPTVSVLQVTKLMVQHQGNCVVIVEPFESQDNSELEASVASSHLRPVGIITERDIIQFQTLALKIDKIQAQTLMSTPLFLISPEDSLWEVHQQMQQRRVRRLVVAGEQGELRGMINQNSLLRAIDSKEMSRVIETLQRQVTQLEAENVKLLQNRARELSEQVQQRTFELEEVNQQLLQEIRERQKTEEVLRENTVELAELYNHIPCGYHSLDKDGIVVRINDTELKMLGYSREEMVGQKFSDLLVPESLPTFQQNFPIFKQRGWVKDLEFQVRCKDGTILPISVSATAIRDEAGNYLMSRSVVTDIRDRKRSEAVLKQQLARDHLIAEMTQSIHQTLDVHQVLQSAVKGLRQFLQTDRVIIFRFQPDWSGTVVAESIATGWTALLESNINDPCFGEHYVEPYRQGRVSAIADYSLSDVEPCYRELMAKFQVRANLVVPILQREQLWGLVLAHHCSAPRQWKTEEIKLIQQLATQLGIAIQQSELYQKNAEQAALIDIASDAIFVRDLSNQILFWSQGAERLYGWKAEEVLEQKAQELFNRESLSKLETALKTTIKQGSWNGELKQLTKEGREIMVESRWTLMLDQWGNPQSILVVNTDITEKKQLTAQLLHAQRLESIGTLAGGLAHDLNNILTPILGFTQLLPLKIPNLDESSLKLLKLIRANALRGADIIKQVLLFSRGTETEWESVSIPQLLEDVLNLIRETFPKSIVIEEQISPNLWQVDGDPTQLHQVLMNLCVNARDAMSDGGKLVISSENLCLDEQYYAYTNLDLEVGNYIVISVTDTGIGIPKNIIDRIFDPFFTTKEAGQGTGLGLSTVIGIVKNHGGAIEVESAPRCGTQFKVYLPASESIATIDSVTAETIRSGQEELILVVDDETVIREVTKSSLEAKNYRVITASNGLEAIAIYAQQPQEIKVVLMDLIMPEMDGLTAMRALKKINPKIKLIATSGLASKEKITAAELIGIKAFLVKPYTAEKLLLNLGKVIETNYSNSL